MKIAFLYFAYKNPEIMRRSIACLSSIESEFFVHIDANSDISAFDQLRCDAVSFTRTRLDVHWAQFSGVRAILLLIGQALGKDDFDYFVLLSGSELPIRGFDHIHRFFTANRGDEFINLVKIPNTKAGKPVSRINTLWIPSERPFLRCGVRLLTKLGFARRDFRKHLGSLEPYAGNTWWALTRDACLHVDDFVKNNSNVVQFFENTFAPEETFIQTILGNSPFRKRVRRNLVFEDWHQRGANPAMISKAHVQSIGTTKSLPLSDIYGCSEALFARKFSDADLEVVDMLEAAVG